MITPESDLKLLLQQLTAGTSQNAEARKNAFRWFNRLYYDVRVWNKSFMEFLDTYPGFAGSPAAWEYRQFIQKLSSYRDSLHERYGTAKGDLCTNLKMLSARYPKDFGWLYEEDEGLYHLIRSLIDTTFATERNIIDTASRVCDSIPDDPDWHCEHHDDIVQEINNYKDVSRMEVATIKQMTDDVGIHLLDINEYATILNSEGSANSNVMVMGEVTKPRP